MKLFIKCTDNTIKQYYIEKEADSASYQHDSGLDLIIPDDITVPANQKGYKIKHKINCMPQEIHGYFLFPRSSISKTPLRLANSVGIIDYGYRGDIMASVDNISDEDYIIEKGTRLFQLCAPDLKSINVSVVDILSESERGDGGFGSSS